MPENLISFVQQHTVSKIDLRRISPDMAETPYFGFVTGDPDPKALRQLVSVFRENSTIPSFDPFDGGSYNAATIAGWMKADRDDALRFMMLAGAAHVARISAPDTVVVPPSSVAREHAVAPGDLEISARRSRHMKSEPWARLHRPYADYT